MRSQFGSIPSLIHELTSLVLLVSFMARWDAAHGQHYGSTFWKGSVGWDKEVPRQRVYHRGNHQQWDWVIIRNGLWESCLVLQLCMTNEIVTLFTHRVGARGGNGDWWWDEGWVHAFHFWRLGWWCYDIMCSVSLSFFNLGLVEVQEVHAGTGTAATTAPTLYYREIFDFLIKLLSL